MTTLISSLGAIKGLGSQTHVRSAWTPVHEVYGVKVTRNAAHDPQNGGAITWDAVLWDTGGFITVPSTTVVIPQPGWYSIVGYVHTQTLTAHYGYLQLIVNGVEFHAARISYSYGSGGFTAMTIGVASAYFSKGETITLNWDSNNTSLAMTAGEPGNSLVVWRVP